jgi:hypothetical protein
LGWSTREKLYVVRALDRAQSWLERHRDNLLPDTLVFGRLAVEVYRRCSETPIGRRWVPWVDGGAHGFRLSSDYVTVTRRMHALFSRLPLSSPLPAWESPLDLGGGVRSGEARAFASSIVVDVASINRALAGAASGAMSSRMLRWCHDHTSSTGYMLSHKLLALVLQAAARGKSALSPRAASVADKVLAELYRELGGTYVDLTAQRVACLVLAGCPAEVLRPGIQWLVQHQRKGGDWNYFEVTGSAYETVERVYTGRSPLLRPPLWEDGRDPLPEAHTLDLVHRGHATAVAACALACWVSSMRRRARSSRRRRPAA